MEMVLAQEELSSAQPLERQQPQQHQRSMQQLPMQQRSMQQHAMQQHPMQQQQQQEHQTQRAVVPAYTPPPLLSAQPLGWQEQQQQRSMQQFPMQHHPGQHHPMQLHQQQQQHQTQRPLVRAPPSQPHGPTTGDANVESRGARLTDVVDTPTASNLVGCFASQVRVYLWYVFGYLWYMFGICTVVVVLFIVTAFFCTHGSGGQSAAIGLGLSVVRMYRSLPMVPVSVLSVPTTPTFCIMSYMHVSPLQNRLHHVYQPLQYQYTLWA